MAAELGFQYSSFPHLAETTLGDGGQNPIGQNPMQASDVVEDDDSWEVRAFAEDTANVMGTTWPPRSYTCTYCRREFRSAQALGGHMNVHRRDRARLHQAQPNPIKPSSLSSSSSSSSTSNSSFIIPSPDFNGGGLCLLYKFPNPNFNGGIINSPSTLNAYIHSPSALFSMSHHSFNNLMMPSTSPSSTAFLVNEHRVGPSVFSQSYGDENGSNQELDLELRLGHGPSAQNIIEKGEKICNLEAACLRKRSSD